MWEFLAPLFGRTHTSTAHTERTYMYIKCNASLRYSPTCCMHSAYSHTQIVLILTVIITTWCTLTAYYVCTKEAFRMDGRFLYFAGFIFIASFNISGVIAYPFLYSDVFSITYQIFLYDIKVLWQIGYFMRFLEPP